MKAKVLLLFISIACAPTAALFGQVSCGTSSTKLACEFPISAQALAYNTVGYNFISATLTPARAIDSSIATQLTQLPIPSASVGVVSLREKGSDVPVPFDNLGPVLTDRPDTVGKGHVFLGFSYQHFNFTAIDGVNLSSLPVGLTFSQASPFNSTDTETYYGSENNNIGFKLDQIVGIVTVGLTKTADLSVVVPFNRVNLSVTSNNFLGFYYDSTNQKYINLNPPNQSVTSSGQAGGVGDVTINFKQLILGGEGSRGAIAAGVSLRIPSGDDLNFLGSGAVGVNTYGLFEYRARLAPHLKLAYQWNGNSDLLYSQTTQRTSRLPGGLQADAGADLKIVRRLTVAVDLLGTQFVNAPSFVLSSAPVSPVPSSGNEAPGVVIPPVFTTVSAVNNTYTTADFSTGLKLALTRHLLVYGNVLIQANNVGLRSDPVPLVGIAFKK